MLGMALSLNALPYVPKSHVHNDPTKIECKWRYDYQVQMERSNNHAEFIHRNPELYNIQSSSTVVTI